MVSLSRKKTFFEKLRFCSRLWVILGYKALVREANCLIRSQILSHFNLPAALGDGKALRDSVTQIIRIRVTKPHRLHPSSSDTVSEGESQLV